MRRKQRYSRGRNVKGNDAGKHHPLSMKDEARNTERHFSTRSNARLRQYAVNFVSAGNMNSDDPATLNNEFCDLALEPGNSTHAEQKNNTAQTAEEATEGRDLDAGEKSEVQAGLNKGIEVETNAVQSQATESFPIDDVKEDQKVAMPHSSSSKPRRDSARMHSSDDDDGDDEVVFQGRGSLRPAVVIDDPFPTASANGNVTYTNPAPENKSPSSQCLSPGNPQSQTSAATGLNELQNSLSQTRTSIPARSNGTSRSRRKTRRRKSPSEVDDEEAILADYIENMLENPSDEASPERDEGIDGAKDELRDGIQDGDFPPSLDERMELAYSEINLKEGNTETENEKVERVEVLEGSGIDAGAGDSEDDKEKTGNTGFHQKLSSGTCSEASGEKVNSTEKSFDDADAPMMSDRSSADGGGEDPTEGPTISVEDLLFDDDPASDFSGNMDYEVPTVPKGWRREPRRRRSRKPQFAAASAFADAIDEDPYGAFDIMDFDRPSLKKKAKGKHNVPEFGLSDSELEWEIQLAWESDRKKKKLKKQQREELRANGQLGKKSRKANAQSGELDVENIINAIRSFLTSDNESLSLPPMDKKNRKLVHETANKLSLGSVSKGRGDSRFPILTKTVRTPTFDATSITKFDRIISANGLMRRFGKGRSFQKDQNAPPTRRAGTKAASFMDGDIVGGTAPEIGIENKGRAMLEKMGWSIGTPLGSIHNQGILQPVAHVVKTNKAGLG